MATATATEFARSGGATTLAAAERPPLYMMRADIDFRQFWRWAAAREIYGRGGVRGGVSFDEGFAMHKLLVESFGENAPQPYRIIAPRGGLRGSLYGYSAADAAALRRAAAELACPLQAKALPPALIDSKLMPADWHVGRRLGFEALLRPVVRSSGRGERDAFLRASPPYGDNGAAAGEAPSLANGRADAYAEWLAPRLERGGARLDFAELAQFRLTRAWRMGKARALGPQALMRGALTVVDPALFYKALSGGIGKHKAYGYGMLLLRPSWRSDISRHSSGWRGGYEERDRGIE